jgi:hypothetical protein
MQFLSAGTREHDPEKWTPVFPRDKRGTRLRGDHAQTVPQASVPTAGLQAIEN